MFFSHSAQTNAYTKIWGLSIQTPNPVQSFMDQFHLMMWRKQDKYSNSLLNKCTKLYILSVGFYINHLFFSILSTAHRKVLLSPFYRWGNWNSQRSPGWHVTDSEYKLRSFFWLQKHNVYNKNSRFYICKWSFAPFKYALQRLHISSSYKNSFANLKR